MFIVVKHNELNTPRGIYRSLVSGMWNFAGFQEAKTSANKRLLIMSATLRRWCADIPSAGSRCKGSELFWIEQEKLPLGVFFFWCRVYGVECKGGDLLGGVPPSTKPVVGIKHVHEWARSAQLLVNYLRILGNLFRIPVNLFRKAVNCFRKRVKKVRFLRLYISNRVNLFQV